MSAARPAASRAPAPLLWPIMLAVTTAIYRYHPQVLEALAGHGLAPLGATAPGQLRDALRELYKYEIRRLRDRLLAGDFPKRDYAGLVVELRKRYWLLAVPTELWTARA